MTTPTPDLPAFLLARYDEREALARAALATAEYAHFGETAADALLGLAESEGAQAEALAHFAANDPAYVLADLEAKRRIVETHSDYHVCPSGNGAGYTDHGDGSGDEWETICPTLRLLALPFADHEDYRQEWKP